MNQEIQKKPSAFKTIGPWLITLACFTFLYFQINTAAQSQGKGLISYLTEIFSNVSWTHWLALMIPYSAFYFLVDSTVVWRVINWFNAKVRLGDILPVRASSYILSILNEQVGKGAMALYLQKREGVSGWQVGSSMLFIMVCELLYLLTWACIGYSIGKELLPDIFSALPKIAALVLVGFIAFYLFARGYFGFGSALREQPLFLAFKQAKLYQYFTIMLMRSPAMLAAIWVYREALSLFGISVELIEMLGILPVIFFGAATPGPLRSVAITLWVTLFPEEPGKMAAFGLVQHNFFIFFNAVIGLLFLRRANRELFGEPTSQTTT